MKFFRPALSASIVSVIGSLCCLANAAADDAPPLEGRFTPLAGFAVQEVVEPGSTGSLVAMSFNETGDIIASREQGPLLLVRDKDHDGKFETITTYCDKVTNCQGILPLGAYVFAVANGPSGTAFYRLSDVDGDGQAEKLETLFKFRGSMGEHGPHAPVLGPDGLIYIMIGNHAGVEPSLAATSPHHHYYDAELITPKYEDANGHAAGIKAPGGTVVRTDINGSFVEMFVGGFRNAYDHAFNRDGELFTYDSDMEWDVALPWYRPTRVNHLIPGAEFGWRSGWSKWPAYFIDSLPATVDTGRGSPTGVVFNDHPRLGKKYDGALFMCDWSQGRILAVTLDRRDGTYQGKSEIFLEGKPLNCSDIDVGPDGWLYFSVGGRNTAGSLFRIVAKDAPPLPADNRQGIAKAIAQPQLASAWARRAVRDVKKEVGDSWGTSLAAIAGNSQSPAQDRVRALDLMQLYSPAPSVTLLLGLTKDANAEVRAKAAYLLGVQASPTAGARLVELLADADATVRRRACEALVRSRHAAPKELVFKLLAEPHPFVAWAARRALEQLPRDTWQADVLASNDPRVFIHGCVALAVLDADGASAKAVLGRSEQWLKQKDLSDDNLLDLLRVIELALHRAQAKPDDYQSLRALVSARFPAGDYRLNRELVRTLVMLQDPTLAPRLVAHLQSKAPLEERIQAAMLARFLQVGWTPELRGELLDFYSLARTYEGGNSYRGYLTNAANDVLKTMPEGEQIARIADGAKSPAAALGVVRNLSGALSPEKAAALVKLDQALAGNASPEARELAQATLVALGHGGEAVVPYLRDVFEKSPDRRSEVAAALATYSTKHNRNPEDWPLLVRSLSVVEGTTARDVLKALVKFPQKDDKPQDQRQVILLGLKLGDNGGRDAAALLQHWTSHKAADLRTPWPTSLEAWQKWFVEKYPDQPEPKLPVEASDNKWTFAQLTDFLRNEGAQGDAERGATVFEKAQCIKCHRYGSRGEGIGPDLSAVSSRFQRKEILESVVFPSQVISDQFAAKTVLTNDGKSYTGIVGPTGDGVIVLQPSGEKVNVAKADIEEIVPSRKSAMPDGLFNTLSLAEIADLFAYLSKPPAAK